MKEREIPGEAHVAQPLRPAIDEYYKLELSQVVQRYSSLETLRVQLGTFFGTANLTALGIALGVQKTGVIFVAAAILFVYLVTDLRARTLVIVYLYRGIQLQKLLAPNDEGTFLRILPGAAAAEARRLAKSGVVPRLSETEVRVQTSFRNMLRTPFFWIPVLVALGETATGLFLWRGLHWSIF